MEKRIERHLRKTKQKFWHIDCLLDDGNVQVLKGFYKYARKSTECKVASRIAERSVSIKGFGSSDCKCKSHLFKIGDYRFLRELMREALFT